MFSPAVLDPTVDLLVDLAGVGPALELGIGTGRVALPLRRRGVDVHGIELSPAMAEQLRAKPGGEDIPVTIGDFATATAGPVGSFRLAYLVFNTIGNLVTQDAQVACFQNAADHLATGGCFVIEVGVPELQRLPPGESDHVFHRDANHVGIDEYDVVTQRLVSHHYTRVGDRYELLSVPFRYVWPSELDLMARIAGMRLRDRWASWTRDPFTAESTSHVSVWEKSAG
jgi:SAM-dependent methyltransferase